MNRIVLFLLGVLVGGAGICIYLGSSFTCTRVDARAATLTPEPSRVGIAPRRDQMTAPVVSTAIATTPPLAVRERFDPVQPAVDPLPPLTPATAIAPEPTPAAQAPPVIPIRPGSLLLPVAGVTAAQLTDTYTQSRGTGRSHDAIDIMAARGTPVFAVDDGKVVKLFNSVPGGLTVYQFDRDQKVAYYYAHLDAYASGVAAGTSLKRGELLGYVGSTGNASPDAPHLHFAVFVLGPEKNWWQGTAINPYPLLVGP
jgi:peptidoglycan LD-endopeptidase LytH